MSGPGEPKYATGGPVHGPLYLPLSGCNPLPPPITDEVFRRASERLHEQLLAAWQVPPAVTVSLPSSENILDRVREAYELIDSAPPRRTEPIKLTALQIAALRRQMPQRPSYAPGVVGDLFGVPIVKVAKVEDSTPYREHPWRFDIERRARFNIWWPPALKHHSTPRRRWWKRAYCRLRMWLA